MVGFLLQVKDLRPEQTRSFASYYHAYLDFFRLGKEYDAALLRFVNQYAILPDALERLAAKLKESNHYWLREVVTQALERHPAGALHFVKLKHFRLTALSTLLMQHGDRLTDDQWKRIFEALVNLPNDYDHFFDNEVYENDAFPQFFREQALRLLNAEHGELQCIGLRLYPGHWSEIRDHAARIINPANSRWYRDHLHHLKVPASSAGFFIELIHAMPKNNLRPKLFASLVAHADPFPGEQLLSLISKKENVTGREEWAGLLLERRPEAKAAVASMMQDLLHEKAIDLFDKLGILRILKELCGKTYSLGALDELWLELKPEDLGRLLAWYRSADDFNVTHRLVLEKLLNLSPPGNTKDYFFKHFASAMAVYVLTSPDPETRNCCMDYILKTLKRVNTDTFTSASLLDTIITARPETARFLLELKLPYLAESNNLYDCMTSSAGSCGDSFQEVVAFVHKHREIIAKVLRKLDPNEEAKWFPYVALLAMDREARNRHGDGLRNLLETALPKLRDRDDLHGAVIAAKALGLEGDVVDAAVRGVFANPPRHHVQEMSCALDGKNKAVLPDLLKHIEAGNRNAVVASIAVAPNNKELFRRLETCYLESPNLKAALNCAEGLGELGRLPPLSRLPSERLDAFFRRLVSDEMACDQFFEAIKDPDDGALVARRMAPLIPAGADKDFGLDPSSLIWLNPMAQAEVAPSLITLLESGIKRHSKYAANNLASCSGGSVPYIERIHARLKRERDPGLRKTLLWAIANIGTPAERMEPTVVPWAAKHDGRALFCLANIATDPEDRRAYLEQLMAHCEKNPCSNTARMVGLVQGQEEIVRPFLIRMLLNGRRTLPPNPEQKWFHEDTAREALWRLGPRPPHPEILDAFEEFLGDLVKERYKIDMNTAGTLFRALRNAYPKELERLAPLIRRVPFRYQLNLSYRLIELDLPSGPVDR